MKQLLNWFRRRNLESGLDRELRYHLERRVGDLSRIRSARMAGEKTSRAGTWAASRNCGRKCAMFGSSRWLRDFVADLRYAARSFLRSPAFTVTVIVSLALGIGATTAIYSLVDQIVLHALPVRQPAQLVLIDWKGDPAGNAFGSWNLMSYPICRDLQQQHRFFDGVLCRAETMVDLSTGADPKPAAAEIVSDNYFSVLGVTPALGRLLGTDAAGTPEANPVVVLSYDFWKTHLAGDRGRRRPQGARQPTPNDVMGVAAPEFHGIDVGEVPSVWIPAVMSADAIPGFKGLLDRRTRWMQILGRLRPDVTMQQAQTGLQPWFKAMLHEDTRRVGFPRITAERRQRFLASTLVLTPAPQGHSTLRRRLAAASLGPLRRYRRLTRSGMFECRGSVPRPRIGSRT